MRTINLIGETILETGMANRIFSLGQVVQASGVEYVAARTVMEKLCREGLARKISDRLIPKEQYTKGKPRLYKTYRITDKKRLRERISPRLRADTAQDRMWKVLRYLRVFTRHDLIKLAESTPENAKWYTKMLRRAGYIKPSKLCGPGVRWMLSRDPGPKRPHVGKSQERRA